MLYESKKVKNFAREFYFLVEKKEVTRIALFFRDNKFLVNYFENNLDE